MLTFKQSPPPTNVGENRAPQLRVERLEDRVNPVNVNVANLNDAGTARSATRCGE